MITAGINVGLCDSATRRLSTTRELRHGSPDATSRGRIAAVRLGLARCILVASSLLIMPLLALADPGNLIAVVELDALAVERQRGGAEWRHVYSDSGRFLAFQHLYRTAFQAKTRRYLGGPFFSDYGASLKGLKGWKDGDSVFTNYILHPIQGAVSGFVLIQNDSRDEQIEIGASREYWQSRVKAMGFAALYSLQFELGPLSEASIGNVGMSSGTMGLVDFVITPIGGFGWILAEDALDRFVIQTLERKWKRAGLIRFVRVALNPARSFANVLRFRLPWYRRGRELNKILPNERPIETSLWNTREHRLRSRLWEESTHIPEVAQFLILIP